MNVLTKIRLINELNQKELRSGLVGTKSSWHNQYKDSAWVYVGSMPYELSEGDVICVFSQYGEIVNINLIRDKKTGKSKGFAFICYEDQRSTVLAVDNLNGTKIKGRQLRVDHVLEYKVPKEDDEIDELTLQIRDSGVAPEAILKLERAKDQVEVIAEEEEILISDSEEDLKVKKKKRKKEKKKKKGLSFLKETPSEKKKKAAELQREHKTEKRKRQRRSSSDDEELKSPVQESRTERKRRSPAREDSPRVGGKNSGPRDRFGGGEVRRASSDSKQRADRRDKDSTRGHTQRHHDDDDAARRQRPNDDDEARWRQRQRREDRHGHDDDRDRRKRHDGDDERDVTHKHRKRRERSRS